MGGLIVTESVKSQNLSFGAFRTAGSVGLADPKRSLPKRLGPTLSGNFLSDALQESPQKIGIADRQEVERKPEFMEFNAFWTRPFTGVSICRF